MRSDSYSLLLRRGNGGVHRIGIAGVKTSRDIRRADQLEQLGVVARAFAKIGVKIDNQIHDALKLRPMRNRSRSRSRSSQEPMRIGQRNFGKTNMITGTKLCRDAKIDRDHVRYFRITADGLAISQK